MWFTHVSCLPHFSNCDRCISFQEAKQREGMLQLAFLVFGPKMHYDVGERQQNQRRWSHFVTCWTEKENSIPTYTNPWEIEGKFAHRSSVSVCSSSLPSLWDQSAMLLWQLPLFTMGFTFVAAVREWKPCTGQVQLVNSETCLGEIRSINFPACWTCEIVTKDECYVWCFEQVLPFLLESVTYASNYRDLSCLM